jgi:hypothetical protein
VELETIFSYYEAKSLESASSPERPQESPVYSMRLLDWFVS